MPQVATNQQPVSKNMSLHDVRTSMKRDPSGHGISSLGYDGVLRTFDVERNVLDAAGLDPTQIREYYDGRPMPKQLLTVDGSNISQEKMFSPNAENIPSKLSEEEKARVLADNEELENVGRQPVF